MAEPGFSEKKEKIGYFLLKMEIPHPVIKGKDESLSVTYALPARDGVEAKEKMKLWVISKFPGQKEKIEKINADDIETVKFTENKAEYEAMIIQAEKSAK